MMSPAIKRRERRTTDDAGAQLGSAQRGSPKSEAHWLSLRAEQDSDMQSKSWRETFSRLWMTVQFAASYLIIVTLMHNGAQLLWSLTLGALARSVNTAHRRFAAHVMSSTALPIPDPAGSSDADTTTLRMHRPSSVLNTHRRVQLPDSEPIDPRELQMIFDPVAACSIPPFPPGSLYPEPLFYKHVSTALGAQRPYTPNSYYREAIPSDHDGCTVCVDWLFSVPPSPSQPLAGRKGVVGVIPGLASSSHSPYIEIMCHHLAQAGYHAAVINGRGMGSTPLDRPSILTGVFTEDIRTVVNRVLEPEGLRLRLGIEGPVFLAGFSLGGAMMCKYLGEEGKRGHDLRNRVWGAAAVCAPWDFHESSNNMLTLEAQLVYAPHLSKGLREYVVRHREMCKQIREIDVEHLLLNPRLTRTVQDIDERVVAPHAGFASREDYYNAATPMPFLETVGVPLMCLTAEDDPITGTPPKDARWERVVQVNPNVCYVKVPAGGHLGFLLGFSDEIQRRPNFMDRTVASWCDNCAARRSEFLARSAKQLVSEPPEARAE